MEARSHEIQMMIYRYSSVHLATIVLGGCVIAVTCALFSYVAVLLLLLIGTASFFLVTTVCYHKNGELLRAKVTQLMLVAIAVYSTRTRRGAGKGTTPTAKGPVSTLIHYESQKIVQLIVRDFVVSWYSIVSKDKGLPRDVLSLLQYLALDLYFRLQRINVNDLILQILPIINPFLESLNEVGYCFNGRSSLYDVNHPSCVILLEKNPRLIHPALKSSVTEVQYLQKLVDSYLLSCVPQQYLKCDIALQLVRNVLVYKLLKPVFDLLCDPVFLIESIPLILSKLPENIVEEKLNNITKENESLELELSKEDGLLASILEYHRSTYSHSTISAWEQYDYEREEDCDLQTAEQQAVELVQSVSAPTEELVHVALPSIYINRHVSVESSKEGGHIGYIIKFPKNVLLEENLKTLELPLEGDDGELEALKRYSEFVKFHNALLKSRLASCIKDVGIALPDKKIVSSLWSRVSSRDQDPTVLIERKEGLDKYIQSIANIPEVRDSNMFREFLVSGVVMLQDANIVSKAAKQSRKKSNVDAKKMSVDKLHDIGHVLDVFLDMQVLLPCHDLLNSIQPDKAPPTISEAPPSSSVEEQSAVTTDLFHLIWSDLLFADFANDEELLARCQTKAPLFSCLMSLATSATSATVPELWLTNTTTQLAFVNVLGQSIDKFLWEELETVVYDETRWARMLYNLRHTLWPDGELRDAKKESINEQEKLRMRNSAVDEIKGFLPNVIPILIGADNYHKTIHHCLDSIQNPRINRHFLYHIVDIIFGRLVLEFSDANFQHRVLKMRSKPLFVSK